MIHQKKKKKKRKITAFWHRKIAQSLKCLPYKQKRTLVKAPESTFYKRWILRYAFLTPVLGSHKEADRWGSLSIQPKLTA